ncbi:MAG: hypothetical protein EBZ48_06130, partial [Proteobacteria bacterium]|nr:hypothetical protein [Pseudomonadota bacterium]
VARFGAAVLRTVGTVAWRFARIAATYLVYLGGMLAMRAAHAAGDLLQRLIEAAIERARTRAREVKEAATARKLEAKAIKAESRVASASASSAARKPAIIVGDSELSDDMEDEASVVKPQVITEQLPLGVPMYSEAPNALDGASNLPVPVDAQVSSSVPEIIPYEKSAASALAPAGAQAAGKPSMLEKAAERAAEKLARAASRAKRGVWKLPSIDFLRKPPKVESTIDKRRLEENSALLKQKFADFGIEGDITAVRPGPVITLYEFKPGAGVKLSRISGMADDISMALSAQSVRIMAPIPGKSVVGIEIPSDTRETVYLREFLAHPDFNGPKHTIPVIMGKDIGGQTYLSDL